MVINSHIPRCNMLQTWLHIFLIGIIASVVVGCGPSDAQQGTDSLLINEAYPVQTDNTQENNIETSSSAQVDAYPAPTAHTGILLALNKPIKPNDTEVSGVGPPGLPINIVNITLMGEQLGAGVVGNDGTFSIPVSLQSNIRVGINANIEAFGLTSEEIKPGDDAMNVPLVGYFFDTVVVSQD